MLASRAEAPASRHAAHLHQVGGGAACPSPDPPPQARPGCATAAPRALPPAPRPRAEAWHPRPPGPGAARNSRGAGPGVREQPRAGCAAAAPRCPLRGPPPRDRPLAGGRGCERPRSGGRDLAVGAGSRSLRRPSGARYRGRADPGEDARLRPAGSAGEGASCHQARQLAARASARRCRGPCPRTTGRRRAGTAVSEAGRQPERRPGAPDRWVRQSRPPGQRAERQGRRPAGASGGVRLMTSAILSSGRRHGRPGRGSSDSPSRCRHEAAAPRADRALGCARLRHHAGSYGNAPTASPLPMAPRLTRKKRPRFLVQAHRRYRPTRTAHHRQTLQRPRPEAVYTDATELT